MLSYSVWLIADFMRNSSQTGVLVGLGSVFLIFGTVLRRQSPMADDETGSQVCLVCERSTQFDGRAADALPVPAAIAAKANGESPYPSLTWQPEMPLNSYMAGLDAVASTVTGGSHMNSA